MYLITDEKADKFTALIDHFKTLFLGTTFTLSPESNDVSVRIAGKIKSIDDVEIANAVLLQDGFVKITSDSYEIFQKNDSSFGSVVVTINKERAQVSLTFNV